MSSDVQYDVLKAEHVERCRELIYDQFIARETFCKCLNVKKFDCGNWFDVILKKAVDQKKSFVAVQNQENIIGLRISFEKHLDGHNQEDDYEQIQTSINIERIGQLLTLLKSEAVEKIRNSCRVIMDFELVVVHEKCARMGVAQKMVELSMNLARNLNFDGVLTVATTPKSIKMFEKLNYVTLACVEGEELLKQFPELKNGVESCDENLSIRAMFKNLK